MNNPRFLSLTELGDDLYEIELNRSNINTNLPMQIGFAILNYAKMYLLSFYYDFLLRFIGRDDFEFMECDTDSTYIALKSPTLNECVLPVHPPGMGRIKIIFSAVCVAQSTINSIQEHQA